MGLLKSTVLVKTWGVTPLARKGEGCPERWLRWLASLGELPVCLLCVIF